MPLNLLNLPATEAERLAYAEGFTMAAELFARIADLEAERDALVEEFEVERDALVEEFEAERVAYAEELKAAKDDSLTQWEKNHGPADSYKRFFEDCFERLAGHYPCPSVTSDHDKSVIFKAIEKGEAE